MSEGLPEAAQRLLPPWVLVAGGRIAALQTPLDSAETAAVARALPARRAAFTAGRTAARAALMRWGVNAALPRTPDGPPLWPPGLTGSITHGGGWCLAAIARLDDCAALGIDIEPLAPLDPGLIAEICTPAERLMLASRPDPGLAALALFSAKEAAYKAQFMLSRRMIGFHDLTAANLTAADLQGDDLQGDDLQGDDLQGEAVTRLTLKLPCGPLPAGLRLSVRQTRADGHLISAVVMARR